MRLYLLLMAGWALLSVRAADITVEQVQAAENLIGLEFTPAERDQMRSSLGQHRQNFAKLRSYSLSNGVPPALVFDPIPLGFRFETQRRAAQWSPAPVVKPEPTAEDLAFASIAELGVWLRQGKVTSERLTRLCLERLRRWDPVLHCVVTLTEPTALAQARRADAELQVGRDRGPLHGIPYGAKDLLAVRGYPTTWGAAPFTNQVFDFDATVIRRLEEAGAVLVAKLTLGELAMGDGWFGGRTRNPWNPEQGSSGSSAGSAAAVAGGLVPFALGSETVGSIVSPATVCGVTGLRPTFGRVSRAGAMALAWSSDKLGPLARTAEDCALVFAAIYGPDGLDSTVRDVPFNYDARRRPSELRIGWLERDFPTNSLNYTNHAATLETLRQLGAQLVPVSLPEFPVRDMMFVIDVEAAAAFDELTRSNADDQLAQQGPHNWPNIFRTARFIPAVEYLRANRVRHELIQAMNATFADLDVLVAPAWEGNALQLSNLTGHPCVVVPNGSKEGGRPVSITFIGRLYGEAAVLEVARAYQSATAYHRQRPPQTDSRP